MRSSVRCSLCSHAVSYAAVRSTRFTPTFCLRSKPASMSSVSSGALLKGRDLLVYIPFDKLVHITVAPIFNQDTGNCICTDGTRWCLLCSANEMVEGLLCFPARVGEIDTFRRHLPLFSVLHVEDIGEFHGLRCGIMSWGCCNVLVCMLALHVP